MKPRDDWGDDRCPKCDNAEPVTIDVEEHAGGACPSSLIEWCGTDHCHQNCRVCGHDWVTTHFTPDGTGWLWAPEGETRPLAAALADARSARRAGEA